MNQIINRIKSGSAFFLHLLPVFFVLHGCMENYNIIPLQEAGILLLIYFFSGLLLFGLSWLIIRNPLRAQIFAAALLSIEFFFGAFIDFMRLQFPASLVSSYTFILPFLLAILIALLVFLRRSNRPFIRLKVYLTTLLLLLITFDLAQIGYKAASGNRDAAVQTDNIKVCDQCPKPDIYLILADGYPGLISLKDVFNMDNTPFLDSLRSRGFYVVDSSHSNYNFTPYSVSSMLNMDFLKGIRGFYNDKGDISVCINTIKRNHAFKILTAYNYSIYNYSIFDFSDQPSMANATFLPNKTSLLTEQTFTTRIQNEIGYHLITNLHLDFFIRNVRMQSLKDNILLTDETMKMVTRKTENPKFVYTHLVMPHYPYYFDSSGHEISYKVLSDTNHYNKKAFISYLYYCNRKLLELTDYIRKNATSPSVILLVSDHGFRELKEPVKPEYLFYNLNAVYLPDSNYNHFYTGMSNINQFSILFNTLFDQQLPLLKDSTSLVLE